MKAQDRARLNLRLVSEAKETKAAYVNQPRSSYGTIPMVSMKVTKKLGFERVHKDKTNLSESTPSRSIRKRKTYKPFSNT